MEVAMSIVETQVKSNCTALYEDREVDALEMGALFVFLLWLLFSTEPIRAIGLGFAMVVTLVFLVEVMMRILELVGRSTNQPAAVIIGVLSICTIALTFSCMVDNGVVIQAMILTAVILVFVLIAAVWRIALTT
jgi:hypothetical protein